MIKSQTLRQRLMRFCTDSIGVEGLIPEHCFLICECKIAGAISPVMILV